MHIVVLLLLPLLLLSLCIYAYHHSSQHITRVLYPTLSCLPHITDSLRLIPHQPQKLASRPTVGAKPFCAFPELSALKFSCSIIIQWSAAPLCHLSCRSPGEEDQPGPLHKDTYNKVPLCGGRVRHCQCVHTSSMRRSVLLHLSTEECSFPPPHGEGVFCFTLFTLS